MTKLFQNYTLIGNQPIWKPFYSFSHKTKSKFKTFQLIKNLYYWIPRHSKAKCSFSWYRVNHNLNSHPADFVTCRDKHPKGHSAGSQQEKTCYSMSPASELGQGWCEQLWLTLTTSSKCKCYPLGGREKLTDLSHYPISLFRAVAGWLNKMRDSKGRQGGKKHQTKTT